jgi:hypothetical protein
MMVGSIEEDGAMASACWRIVSSFFELVTVVPKKKASTSITTVSTVLPPLMMRSPVRPSGTLTQYGTMVWAANRMITANAMMLRGAKKRSPPSLGMRPLTVATRPESG